MSRGWSGVSKIFFKVLLCSIQIRVKSSAILKLSQLYIKHKYILRNMWRHKLGRASWQHIMYVLQNGFHYVLQNVQVFIHLNFSSRLRMKTSHHGPQYWSQHCEDTYYKYETNNSEAVAASTAAHCTDTIWGMSQQFNYEFAMLANSPSIRQSTSIWTTISNTKSCIFTISRFFLHDLM